MRRLAIVVLFGLAACQSSVPPGVAPVPSAQDVVFVTASTLNVRREPSASADVIGQVRRGDRLTVIASNGDWTNVRLTSERTGWVSSAHVNATAPDARSRRGCPPDSEFRFARTPTPDLRPTDKHGLVVVDATVDLLGNVTASRVVSNSTSDPALAQQAEREIRSAKFIPPVRDCAPRTFIFSYKRTF
jgi:TonB family protein